MLDMKEIYLAGGCFWGMQKYFDRVTGVIDTQVGFANGNMIHPSYMEVCTGQTGFAEVVKVSYNENIIPLRGILELFFRAIDPTLLNRQGNDVGTQYRSGIYYSSSEDGETALDYVRELQKSYTRPVVTEITPLKNYYPAEEYHQHYLEKNPSGYCHIGREATIYAGEYRL
jgi:methionine-S-sulfoxide reductase